MRENKPAKKNEWNDKKFQEVTDNKNRIHLKIKQAGCT